MPEAISRLELPTLPLFDGDVVFGDSAWDMIAALAALHDDELVHFLTIEPGPDQFSEPKGRYGFTIPSDSTTIDYGEALYGSKGPEHHVTTLGYVVDVAAVFGESLDWGIWTERNVAGLVVGKDPELLQAWQLGYGPFLAVEEALQDFLGINLGSISDDAAAHWKRNYR